MSVITRDSHSARPWAVNGVCLRESRLAIALFDVSNRVNHEYIRCSKGKAKNQLSSATPSNFHSSIPSLLSTSVLD